MQVEVYRNLNKGGYSIRDRKTKKVIGHEQAITLKDCSFHVGEGGRQRVIREGQKNVHAYVRGELVTLKRLKGRFTYDPYLRGDFFDKKTGKTINNARLVSLDNTGAYYEI